MVLDGLLPRMRDEQWRNVNVPRHDGPDPKNVVGYHRKS
jgi:hypothetical protein